MEDSSRRARAEMHFQRTTRADQDESACGVPKNTAPARRVGSTLLGANGEADVVAVNVHWPAHAHELAGLETLLQERRGAPHLGKLHALPAGYMASVMPGLADFERVAAELDPCGIFKLAPGGSSLP